LTGRRFILRLIRPMSLLSDQVIAILASQPVQKVQMLVKSHQLARYLESNYPPRPQDLEHGSQEAEDAANVSLQEWDKAEKVWPQLGPTTQNELIAQLQEQDPGIAEALHLLDPPDEEEPEAEDPSETTESAPAQSPQAATSQS
jgi:hypothetical protein